MDDRCCVVVDGVRGRQYDAIGEGTPVFSPDGEHIAYSAQEDDKWLIVVDGEEGKRYDAIGKGDPIFSPDSKRLAYVARENRRMFVVIDGAAGVRYDNIITTNRAGITFDSPNQLHYLVFRGSNVYLVEEHIE